jgi:hypothetical protein
MEGNARGLEPVDSAPPSHLPLAARLVPYAHFEIDFIGRIHGHSGSNQVRRKKTRKTFEQATAAIERSTSRCKSFGRFDGPRTNGRKEAGDVGGLERKLGEQLRSDAPRFTMRMPVLVLLMRTHSQVVYKGSLMVQDGFAKCPACPKAALSE